ncbi:uncharacterized protein SAPINGB_P001648 [Magnusiomyces paraingens]|uniref:Uncharacterized protein n=1 Tax=Magnusiomyces paraingens TaxID=2606893 RepID=A0A5E8BCV8_9ASCO|nr:uncharacterized protein SAPINGB_P001648 [Saprochaete ingens]VVT47311.1 unnamed protein product [Saprochaete ingens]
MSTNGSVIADTPQDTPTAPEQSSYPKSLFFTHLYSYPAVNAAVDYATHIPVVQRLSTSARPYLDSLKERSKPISEPVVKRATPVLAKADVFGDKILSRVDENFPLLKTTTPADAVDLARKPYETVKSTAEAYSTAAHDRLSTSVVEPLKKAGERVKEHYTTVYDSKSSTIKSQVDPLIHPLNDRFEFLIKHFFPESSVSLQQEEDQQQAPSEKFVSAEVARTVYLAHVALQQARPLLDVQASHLKTLPEVTRKHILHVYDEKLTAYGKDKIVTGPVYASVATFKQLSGEGVVYAGHVLTSTREGLKSLSKGSTSEGAAATTSAEDIDSGNLDTPTAIPVASATTATTPTNATSSTTSLGSAAAAAANSSPVAVEASA